MNPVSDPISLHPYWRKCTTCKNHIQLNQKYWVCSVSTCNRIRTDLVFCNLQCFDAHVPVMNHRDAGAFERTAPRSSSPQIVENNKVKKAEKTDKPEIKASSEGVDEILVVVSKVKAYIRAQSGMNTSDSVSWILTQYILKMTDLAIEKAKSSGRQTLMERDF